MQQFIIPQFIDEEPHILGPITVRQFLLLLIAGFFIFLSYRLADTALFIVLTIVLLIISITLAFVRVNGRPFHFFLLNLVQTLQRPRLRIWRKEVSREEIQDESKMPVLVPTVIVAKAPISRSRLAELSLIVDTGGAYAGTEGN
ncbi:MAG: PrgI family protein [Patescibacteria group bacterium]|jgi:hypothetical protein